MSYENAPATKMLATQCAVCNRPLVDAKSVETGMGPECRRKPGFALSCSEETRTAANKIVYRIALARSDAAWLAENGNGQTFAGFVARETEELRDIGFEQLAGVIEKRAICVRIVKREDGALNVFTPYKNGIGEAFQRIPGRCWSQREKANTIPNIGVARKALFKLLTDNFAGETAIGPKGPFTIPA